MFDRRKQTIVEAANPEPEALDFASFCEGDDCEENIYFLVERDALDLLREEPVALAVEGVLATNDPEIAEHLKSEVSDSSLKICYVSLADLNEGDLSPVSGKSWRESVAETGLCKLAPTNPKVEVEETDPDEQDKKETIEDLAGYLLGEGEWEAKVITQNETRKIWTCSQPGSPVFLCLEKDDSIYPYSTADNEDSLDSIAAQAMRDAHPEVTSEQFRSGLIEESVEVLSETLNPRLAATIRLKRIATDFLNRDPEIKGKVKEVRISGNKMTAKVGRRTYIFDLERDDNGWIKNVKFVWPKQRKGEASSIEQKINNAFSDAQFAQVLRDACSEQTPRLVMLDYVRQDTGGRRTRLVEPYSYRYKSSTNRTYFYGWNVEEGGIRSYITKRIKGARKTDKDFKPRFLVEIGAAERARKKIKYNIHKGSIPKTVSKSTIRRAHERFDLKGGYGKIIKALGRAVASPYQGEKGKQRDKMRRLRKALYGRSIPGKLKEEE